MKKQTLTKTFPDSATGLRAGATLNSGHSMPWLGFGVWQIRGDAETEKVVRAAIEKGYRHIDTAKIYDNERGVGAAIRHCGVPREQLFITTKVWNDDNRAGRIEQAFDRSLKALGLDYVDLYLVHWPITGRIGPTWKAMERLLQGGRTRAIGVSNHLRPHLDELLAGADVVPAVNQIEFHPYLQSKALVEYCHAKGIQPEAWSPLMVGGPVLRDLTLLEIAQRHGRTPAQIILRWDVQTGVVTIPKSVRPERIEENAAIFDFSLSDAEMAAIAALDRDQRSGPDPMHVTF